MRIPRSLAWFLIVLTVLTAGLLRQFNTRIPTSPYVPPAAGSLLFASILFLFLVAARERRLFREPGPGVRLGSLTPLLLMLLVEKWISLALYNPVFYWITPEGLTGALLDARYRAFSGIGLIAVCLLVGRFSVPAGRQCWSRSRPRRWPPAAAATAVSVAGTYLVLGALGAALGASAGLRWPGPDRLWAWTVAGQAVRAFAEELYYRGLLLFEILRLAPRLGVRRLPARRWIALALTSGLFGLEHLDLGPPAEEIVRRFIFTVSLGLLLGIVVLLSSNLHLAAGLHAWINWLLLGAAPRFADGSGESLLPPGTYIALALALSFVLLFLTAMRRAAAPP